MIGEMLNDLLRFTGDSFLGWALRISPDLVVALLALITALLLTLLRRLATDQEWLGRCHADQRRLAELRRAAKQAGDRAEMQRLRQLEARLGLKKLRAELRPLLCALLPLALLGGWAWQRLEYLPPPLDAPVAFTARFPLSAAGQLAYLRPSRDLRIAPTLIQEIQPAADPQAGGAQCAWTVAVQGKGWDYLETAITVRWRTNVLEHPVRAGTGPADAPVIAHPVGVTTELAPRRYHAFGIIPNLPGLWLPSWLLAYLLLAVPAAFALKRVFRVR